MRAEGNNINVKSYNVGFGKGAYDLLTALSGGEAGESLNESIFRCSSCLYLEGSIYLSCYAYYGRQLKEESRKSTRMTANTGEEILKISLCKCCLEKI